MSAPRTTPTAPIAKALGTYSELKGTRRFIAAPLLVVVVELGEEGLPVDVGVDVGAVPVVVMDLPSANFCVKLSVCVRALGEAAKNSLDS